jgi:hypothetical protein
LRRRSRLAAAALAVTVAATAVHGTLEQRRLSNKQDELGRLEQQVATIVDSDAYRSYLSLQRALAKDRTYLENARANPTYLNLNLKELSNLTPEAVTLSRLEINPADSASNMRMHGRVATADVPPEIVLAEFVESLRGSPFYQDVAIDRHSKHRLGDNFVIEFELEMKGLFQ